MLRVTLLVVLALLPAAALQVSAASPAAALQGRTLVGSRPVADAVIWLDVPGSPHAGPGAHALMDQRNLTFIPHVLAIQTGTTVDFPNHDRVFHNVFSYHDGRRFDLGLYPTGAVRHIKFDHVGLCRLFCNIHPNMAAYIMVVDTPFFAVSDSHGGLTIPSVPAGHYHYHAWRPTGSVIEGDVTVGGDAALEVRWPR